MSLQSLNKNKYFKWTNIIIIGIIFLTLMVIDIINVFYDNLPFTKMFMNPYIWIAISTYVVFVPGITYFKSYVVLIKKKRLYMDLLISLAIHISYIFSLVTIIVDKNLSVIWEPIGLLYVFDTIGKQIEGYIGLKNDNERSKLETLKEKFVINFKGNKVNVNDVKIGDVIIFKKGDVIQFDGLVFDGESIIDTSNINGESKLYYAKKNSNIISGSKVISEKLELKVEHNFKNSTLNKLILLINKTNNVKPNIQKIADKIAKILIPSVLLMVILMWIIWIILGYNYQIEPYVSSQKIPIYNSFLISISILAIACPCAMTMTAPLINLVSAQSYWKSNIIFNKTKDMEKILFITDVILDKTGTLTTNEMEIVKYFGAKKYHHISAGLEKSVYHPIANSIYKKFKNDTKIENIKNLAGTGVKGIFENRKYIITKVLEKEIKDTFKETNIPTGTYVGLYEEGKLKAAYILQSKIKKDAHQLINYFLSKNINPIILSGDNEKSTKEVANKLGIKYRYNQSPENKARYIQSLQKNNKKVLMIGDGLNDSIAIKYSDVSISFSSGSSIANSYSSISLLGDELLNIVFLIRLGKLTRKNYKIAIGWAIGFNLMFLPIAAAGFILPWLSALIMYISNIILFIIIFIFKWRLNRLEKSVFGKQIKEKVKLDKKVKPKENTQKHMCH